MGDEFNTVDWGGLLIAADAFVVIDSMADFAILSPSKTSFASWLVPGIPCSVLSQPELFLFLLNL